MNKLAFVYPGQGCQSEKMGLDFYNNYSSAREVFEITSNALGQDMAKLCFESDLDTLSMTENTQPAIFTVSMALASILTNHGIKPSAFAGLSLGEYSGLCAANSISLEDGVKLVRKRGQLMQEEVPVGKGSLMAVMGLNQFEIEQVITPLQNKGIISCSNINSDKQIVVGGEIALLKEAESILKSAGAKKVIFLNVSAPFHTKMLTGAGKKLKFELDAINLSKPEYGYYPNFTGKLCDFDILNNNIENAKSNIHSVISYSLEKQVCSPVLWNQTINNMIIDGIDTFVEVYPGSVASALIKKIDKNVNIVNLSDIEKLETFLKTFC